MVFAFYVLQCHKVSITKKKYLVIYVTMFIRI